MLLESTKGAVNANSWVVIWKNVFPFYRMPPPLRDHLQYIREPVLRKPTHAHAHPRICRASTFRSANSLVEGEMSISIPGSK
jgi:hypothetical protein